MHCLMTEDKTERCSSSHEVLPSNQGQICYSGQSTIKHPYLDTEVNVFNNVRLLLNESATLQVLVNFPQGECVNVKCRTSMEKV